MMTTSNNGCDSDSDSENEQAGIIHTLLHKNKRIKILMDACICRYLCVVDADRPHSETAGSEECDDDLEDVRELTNDEEVQEAITQLPAVSSVDFDVQDVDTQEELITQFMTSG